jgi:rfaE bifunctional protein nucleotidyltransferase chain/domain
MDRIEWIERKRCDRETAVRRCNALRATGKKIVFTNGCFDILHRGHIEQLARAADMGDVLMVGVNTDASVKGLKGPGRPVNSEDDRSFQLAALLCVDIVCLFDEETPASLIEAIRPDVLVKGGDYTVDQIAGADFVLQHGGRVEIIPFVSGYSTTSLIGRIREL